MLGYVFWGVLTANLGLLVWYGVSLFRLRRAINRWVLLDQLMTQMAIQSFATEHMPLWKAWSGVMGSFEVDFNVQRHIPKAGD